MGQGSTSTPDKTPRQGIPLPLVRWRGFTLQMFLFLLLPLTVLLLAIVFVSQSLHHNEMRALVGERDLRAVRSAANTLSDAINQRVTALAMLSYQAGDRQAAPDYLDQAAQAYGMDGGLAVFDPRGGLVARSGNAAPEILDLQQAREMVNQAGSPENAAAARLSAPTRTADGRWLLLVMAQPGADSHTLVGAFSAESLAREALSGVAGEQSVFMLVSAQGEILFASGAMQHAGPINTQPGVADVLRGESGVNYMSSNDGMMAGHSGEHVIAFSPVQPFGWGLVLEEPWQQSAGPLLTVTQSAPLILAPVLALALLALWFGIRQIIQPLQALENRAGKLAAGDFAAIRAPVGGIDEIQNLQDELVAMAGALQSAQQALHSYIGALTAGLETERRSLARELHDDTLQALIALNQHLQMALLRATDTTQRQPLLDLQSRVAETIANLRQAIGGLRPIYLEDLGLVAALGMLAKNNANTTGQAGPSPRVEFQVNGPERRLSAESELAFYRIAQEALNNALHHAQATEVQVELAFEEEFTRLSICDNGQGFTLPPDPGAFAHHGHYGLLGMHERADLIGADLKIDTARGKGTRVTVKLAAPTAQ
jgi:two-component system sensor histidine kinase UhpB